jgi:hypothetical protein
MPWFMPTGEAFCQTTTPHVDNLANCSFVKKRRSVITFDYRDMSKVNGRRSVSTETSLHDLIHDAL